MRNLDKVQATLKRGNETLIHNGINLEYSLLDFWRWSVSDLLSNATRGRFAEFIVASATGVNLHEVRDEWAAFDLITPSGIKIEVKSAAYIQSWFQKVLSSIKFSIKTALTWNSETNMQSALPLRSADVYVFCLLHHENKQTCDPLNLNHWEFYVIATEELNRRPGSQHSITINSLRSMADPINYSLLANEIDRMNKKNSCMRGEHIL